MGRASRWLAGLLGWKKSENNASHNSESKQKKWRFGKSYRETKGKGGAPPSVSPVPVEEEMRGSYREEFGNERAIAVANATAAVAEAAVAAAQAAAEVVRMTRSGGRSLREDYWAAINIQSVFRGYLARRALKALKGLVRLQALARGNIIRKQVSETLRCMHALVRVQARARTCRALKSDPTAPLDRPPRSNGPRSQRSASRNSWKRTSGQNGEHNRSKSVGWNWLDRWMEEKCSDEEKDMKILEVDPGKPMNYKQTPQKQHASKNSFMMTSSCSTLTQLESPSKDSTTAHLSVPSPSTDMAESSLNYTNYPNYQIPYEESPYYSTSSKRGGLTPSKSEYSSSYTDYYPNYMTNTQSSRAKARSQSAPKQRPGQFEKLGFGKKGLNGGNNLHLKFASKGYPGSGRLDRMGMPVGY